jgi:hypothetical protein
MAKDFIQIEKSALVVGEGRDEVIFFTKLLQSIDRADVQVTDHEGVDKLEAFLHTLHAIPGYAMLTHLVVTRDADAAPEAAFQSVEALLAAAPLKAELPNPKNSAREKPVAGPSAC